MIPTFIRSYEASADVAPHRIVKFSDAANSSKAAQAAANTDPLIGVSDKLGGSAGEMFDVIRAGLGKVQLGGAVSAGDPLTADADGKAVKAVVTAGAVISVIGHAEQPGVADDIIDFFVARGTLAKPSAT